MLNIKVRRKSDGHLLTEEEVNGVMYNMFISITDPARIYSVFEYEDDDGSLVDGWTDRSDEYEVVE